MKNNICGLKSPSGHVKSFSENLMNIKNQIYYDYFKRNFERDEIRQVDEFCKIIADVLTLPPDSKIKIGKEERFAESVQEIYLCLDERHIETVLEHFNKVTYKITSPKTYIRTALFNAYFELENQNANENNVRCAQ